jgi:hypothetical protein
LKLLNDTLHRFACIDTSSSTKEFYVAGCIYICTLR